MTKRVARIRPSGSSTTTQTNGGHTIGWLVYGNQGQGAGIGSRFFTVQN